MNLRDITIGIIGGGVVGQATARSYIEHVKEVRVHDRVRERSTHGFIATVSESDIVFICLPETEVEEMFHHMVGAGDYDSRKINWVLKSTVPIGTTRRLHEQYGLKNLVHSPEFLTARCATIDAQMPARNIIGLPMPQPVIIDGHYNRLGQFVRDLYNNRWPGVPSYIMTSDESEAVKLFQNAFFAVKVAFWNEVNSLAVKLGLDWQRVLNAILADGRIHPSHTQVPGPDGKYGFGGACLPKDLQQLVEMMRATAGVDPYICEGAFARNFDDRERK